MKAVTFNNQLFYEPDHALPRLTDGEVLIQVLYAGICNTDLEILQGYMGYSGILGHEFVGRVVGPDASPWLGKRVVGEINCGCGACHLCRSGDPRHCAARTVLGILERQGIFAGFTTLPENCLHEVPHNVTDRQAVFAEPLAAACRITEQVPKLPETVLVVGDGKLGLLIAQVLSTHSRVTLLGHHPARAARICGTEVKVIDAPPACSFSLVVEASGTQNGLSSALNAVSPEGTLVLKSTYHGRPQLDLALSVVVPEVTIVGSRCGPFAPALDLLASGAVNVSAMIDGEYALQEATAAFDHAARPGALKILFHCG